MRCVLVTGPIGSGKSEVCRYLAALGYPVYDCDSRTKALYDSVPGLKSEIESALGIEWSQIGVIFSDEARRLKLESIVYPLLLSDLRSWKAALGACPLAFVESAVALDKRQFDAEYDSVLLVRAALALRAERNPKALERDHLQSFDESRVSYILDNDSTKELLHNRIEQLLCKLI